jgi:hypothetical protein
MKTPLLLSFAICLLFVCGAAAAQETDATQAVIQDETISAESLGVAEPTVLPNSPFYFIKNIGRAVQSAVTFDPVKKAALREKFANEKLLELKKLTEETQDAQILEKATQNYQIEIENVKKAAERIKQTATENSAVGDFLDKYIQQQTLHQTILQKLGTQVSTTTMARIEAAREAHLENFGEVMQKLENKDKIQQRLETNLQEIQGSNFKEFQTLEILDSLQEKAPQALKEAVQNVRTNTLNTFKEKVQEMTTQQLQQFQDYAEQIGGVKEVQVEILDSLKSGLKNSPQILQNLNKAKETIIERVREEASKTNCPTIQKPDATFCNNGRTMIKKDDNGCIVSFDCIIPAGESSATSPSNSVCTTLWDPVCGKDNKTYSNACFAKLAGVEYTEEACASISDQIKEQIKKMLPQSISPSNTVTQ